MHLGLDVLAFLALMAFIAGWVDAVVGGGGLIQLPSLLLALPSDTPVAVISANNKLASASGTLAATITYLRKVRLHWRPALALVVASFIGSAIGANLVRYLPKDAFTPIVFVALVGVGLYTVLKPQMGLHHKVRLQGVRHGAMLFALGLVVGAYDGFLGPGTGSFFVIGMVALGGYGFLQASAMARLANLTTNLAALAVLHHHIIWVLGITIAVANLTGGLVGSRMAVRLGSKFVRWVFLVVVGVLAIKLGWDTVRMFVH